MNQKEWQCSQTFKLPSNDVQCLILNKQEDQLISGGFDHEIIVWKVDFMENNLTFLNSLNKNSNRIHLVLIKLKLLGLEGKWKFKYKQSVQYGNKIYFINDQQFLWVTRDKQINDILVFELENGVFKQNSNKTITLNKNNECDDNSYFPIKNHKDRNVILAKYQHHIDLIMQQWIIFCIFEQKRKKYSFYPMRYFKIE
ncbi:unnamed protein product [Paramecium sonneborni]|uniref:Uncharacterized protein n=1 Tax=Paramecium sonneborni TaxID=65129 RepID=A0A8S1RTQ0_9CILI|nr:unnamed protein product [Paramecium sonneborni]